MNQNSIQNIQEDEIDLKELFKTIGKNKKFIFIFTTVITLFAVVYSLIVPKTYEVKAVLEIGSYSNSNSNSNSNSIENPQNLIKRVEITYIDNASKEDDTTLVSVNLVKGTTNLLELIVNAPSNEKGKEKIENIINEIQKNHNLQLDDYIKSVQSKITNLTNQKNQYLNNGAKEVKVSVENFPTFSRYGTTMLEMVNQIEDLTFSLSANSIKRTQLIGNIITNEYPIKPKKTLIVTVAFVTGLILSIFLLFFMEFIKGLKEEKINE
ncbi:MAG: Wzz/FepE/Etk N-terminal domain-containing protein [Arcobacteraceae bacterium]|jgi:uncharacterized protein involved in exopolysaccharide biosynthesis|nr:Wzz/FepE/Etk N-terminal domain-containing protein [Arcobacteraceae bacterium]